MLKDIALLAVNEQALELCSQRGGMDRSRTRYAANRILNLGLRIDGVIDTEAPVSYSFSLCFHWPL